LTTLIGSPGREAPATAGASPLSEETRQRLERGRAERRVLATGLALTGAFAAAAVLSAIIGGGIGWAALHLALVGASTVGIGTFMPHFTVTLAGTEPERAPARLAVLGTLAASGAAVSVGVPASIGWLVVIGAAGLLAGTAGTGWMSFAPLRRGIVRRHPIVQVVYGAALFELAIGVTIALLLYLGWPPVVSRWADLKLAHGWLNLFGFVSLTVAGTLVYLFPTVVGARIRAHASLLLLVVGCVAGPPIVALGAALGSAMVTAVGAWLTVGGAVGQAWYVGHALSGRGRWAFDHDWHRAVIWHLAAGTGWFVAATATLALRLTLDGPTGWSLGAVAVPLVAGWVLQELIGSWSHLLPAVGPGDAAAHARQRDLLGRRARWRVGALNLGVLAGWVGFALGVPVLAAGGGILLVGASGTALVLLGRALRA
jgi:nitrite reductase (NO-forming)